MAKKILVVDDEPNIVKMVESRLKANGYDVISAFDGKEGIEKAKQNKPDLIVLDILMPEMDGTAVAEELKKDAQLRGIPIIFLTCLVEKGEIRDNEHMIGGNLFIAKPFEPDELLSMINQSISKQRST